MKTSLDCIPCFTRQALTASRSLSIDPADHERIVREVLAWVHEIDMNDPPPAIGQRIHRRLREITGVDDPYRAAKDRQNRLALDLLPDLRSEIVSSKNPLMTAARFAIAGNVIDMGVCSDVTESDVRQAIHKAMGEPLSSDWTDFMQSVSRAKNILYLADNAGEIVFDRLLIEQLSPNRITVVVRGGPIINDATLTDARTAGLDELVTIIDNGSDAPGTILTDCNQDFQRHFASADLIIAKGQGNFETLSDESQNIFFLFKVKCSVVGTYIGIPVGTHVLGRYRTSRSDPEIPSQDSYTEIKKYVDELVEKAFAESGWTDL